MRIHAISGDILFALAVLGLGIVSLATGHFAAVWEPVPKGLPARHLLAYGNGVLMLVLGIGLLRPRARTRGRAAFLLTAYLVLWFLLHVPVALAAPGIADHWSAFGECATMIVGALLVYADATARDEEEAWARLLSGASGVRIARVVYAVAAFLMSLANLAYLRGNADFPPAWIPHWIGWGYLVGLGFIATGLAVLCRAFARLATFAAAWMMSLLTLACWVSFVIESPGERLNWTGLMISSMLSGAGWLVAETYRSEPWLGIPWHSRRGASGPAVHPTPHAADLPD